MLAAVMCLLVIMVMTGVAIQQSIGSLSGFAQGRKLLQTSDAAEAGVQSEISVVQHWLSAPNGTVPCAGGSAVTGLPSGTGWVPAGTSSAGPVVDAASLGYYTLAVATYVNPPTGSPTLLPTSDNCYNNTIPAPTGASSWYALVQAKGITSATAGGTTATGRTLQALLLVHNYSLAGYHHSGSQPSSNGRVELVAFYTSGTTTYTSNASAQAVNFGPLASTPSIASYGGGGPPDPNNISSSQPANSIFNGESWLSGSALAQYAEADSSGSSKSCSGLVAPSGSIQVGSSNPSCGVSGSPGPTGVTLDLSKIPGLGSVLSSLADVTVETSALTSSASMGTGGSPASGTASVGTVQVKVSVVLGVTVTLSVTVASGPNQNLLGAITSAISGDAMVIGPIALTIVSTLTANLGLTSNYQTTVGGVFSVSAIHLAVLSTASVGDIALSTVGPNAMTTGSPTTTTIPPSTTTTPTTLLPTTTTLPPNTLTIVWIKQLP